MFPIDEEFLVESNSPLLRLPPEVIRKIFIHLRSKPRDILSMATVGNAILLECAREQLYRAVLLVPTSTKLMRTLTDNEHLADLVRDATFIFNDTQHDVQCINGFTNVLPYLTSLSTLRIEGISRWSDAKRKDGQQEKLEPLLEQFWDGVSNADTVNTLHFRASVPTDQFRPPPYFNTLALCSEMNTVKDNEVLFPPGLRRLFYEVTDAPIPPQVWFTLEDLVVYSGGEKTEVRINNIISSLETYYSQHSGLNKFAAHFALRRLTLDCEELSLSTLKRLLKALRGHPLEHLHLLCVPDEHTLDAGFELFHDISRAFGPTLTSLIIYLGRGYEIVPWASAIYDLASACQNSNFLKHIEINHSDGFTGPGRLSDAKCFARHIPSLRFISFGGKFQQCLSVSWAIERHPIETSKLLQTNGALEETINQSIELVEVGGSERRNPRPSAREWSNHPLFRRTDSSVPPTPGTPATAW